MTSAPVLRAAHVRRTPEQAFRLFTDSIGAWWPLDTHSVHHDASIGVEFADGQLVERSADGHTNVWGEVLVWEPPHHLALTWHPGRSQGPAGRVDVRFIAVADGTRVELQHSGWEAFGERASAVRRAYSGPQAWGSVLDAFADLADLDEPSPQAQLLDGLAAAYDAFFAQAAVGGFEPPPPGEWTAEQVVAHVAANDDALAAVSRGVLLGRDDLRLDNSGPNDPAELDRLIEACGGELTALVEAGRRRAATLMALLSRLSPEQAQTLVDCRLTDHGEVMLADAVPWGGLALRVQAERHLPAHTRQLALLRVMT